MKKNVLFSMAICIFALTACSYEEPLMEQEHISPQITTVYVKEGKIVDKTRSSNEGAIATLSFSSEEILKSYQAFLASMSKIEKAKTIEKLGVISLAKLERTAKNELDSIGTVAQSEEDFRKMYAIYTKKYENVLLTNYLDKSDLQLYIPEIDQNMEYIANNKGEYVVSGNLVKIQNKTLPDYVRILSSIPTTRGISSPESDNPTFTNSYVYSPERHKRVKFEIKRINAYDIKVCMKTEKKLWYGWVTDDYRCHRFIYNLNNFINRYNTTDYCEPTRVDKVIGKCIPIQGSEKYPRTVTGKIYTWTDLTADKDENGNVIYEPVTRYPMCSPAKAVIVNVNLPYEK